MPEHPTPPRRTTAGDGRRGPGAALQFVRKISGYRRPSAANAAVLEAAVDEIARASRKLLDGLLAGAVSKPAELRQRRPDR